jgi:hypothetical protein
MTIAMRRIAGVLWAASVLLLVAGCWPRISKEKLPADVLPTSMVEGYPYARERARDWCPTAFLQGANASYRLEDSIWRLYGLSYVFVDTDRDQYAMVVLNLEDGLVQIHPPTPIQRSLVTTSPFFLHDIPIQEDEALEIADYTLGGTVAQKCSSPELALRGSGSGEDQYWDITYAAQQPMWTVVGELSLDAITGEVVVLEDLTRSCDR